MHLRFSEILRYQLDGTPAADGVAEPADVGSTGGRMFVPGVLPCGECPACRRGLVAICPAKRTAIDADAVTGQARDVPDRFLTPLDDPPDLPDLSSPLALLAGPVALAQQALALASAAPGDVAVWLGADPLARLGARVAGARGLKSFLLVAAGDPPLEAEGVSTAADPASLPEAIAAAGPRPEATPRAPSATSSPPAPMPPSGPSPPSWRPPAER